MTFERFNRIPSRVALSLLALLALTVRDAGADWPRDPYVGNVPVSIQPNFQWGVKSVPDGAGGVILAWMDNRSGASSDIYAQRIAADGAVLWTTHGVPVCTAAGDQSPHSIVPDGAGGAVIAWEDRRTGSADIYVQRIDANGVLLWDPAGVPVCQAIFTQQEVRAVSDGAGGAIVLWRDSRNAGSGGSIDLYAQRVDALGDVQWTVDGVPFCSAPSTQSATQAIPDGSGGVIAVWEDFRSGNTDLYAQRLNAGGIPLWTVDGIALCTAADTQRYPRIIPDGQGGAIVAWDDWRFGLANGDVYAQRLNAAGTALWGTNGVAVSAASGSQGIPVIGSDGSGGAIIAWWDQRNGADTDLYAQRVAANGAGLWTTHGVPLATGPGHQTPREVVADGLGGAIIVWDDNRHSVSFDYDIYAQRVSANGSARWTANGVAVCAAVDNQSGITAAGDGAGGAIVAWSDTRGGSSSDHDVYAQRIDRFGQLGSAEPRVTSLVDVVNDQGGAMRLAFAASYLDEEGFDPDLEYTVWRSIPAAQMLSLESLHGVTTNPDEAVAEGRLLVLEGLDTSYAWELVAELPAYGLPSYSFVVPTTGDSVQGSNPLTAVMVMVHDRGNGNAYWASSPDSGYSVDNLPPAMPAGFVANRAEGATDLAWTPNEEIDLAEYRLYRGPTASFEPSPENLVSAQLATEFSDPTTVPWFYKLLAMDVHGNLSPVALAGFGGTTAVGDAPAEGLWFAAPAPNPARGSATLRWSLPAAAHTRLEIFDAAGRRVRSLVDGMLQAGPHSTRFDLAGEGGVALPSGVYLARLETPGRVLTRRIMSIR